MARLLLQQGMRLLLFVCLLGPALPALAQKAPAPKASLRLGIGLAGHWYSGDLTQRRAVQGLRPGLHLLLHLNAQRRVSPQVHLGWGSFAADDRELPLVGGQQANTFVRTEFFYACFMLRVLILKDARVKPHAGLGVGLLRFTPYDSANQSLASQAQSRTPDESYGSGTAMLPLNLGCSIGINDRLRLGFDYYRLMTASPYLDNIKNLGRGTGNDVVQQLQVSLSIRLSQQQ